MMSLLFEFENEVPTVDHLKLETKITNIKLIINILKVSVNVSIYIKTF